MEAAKPKKRKKVQTSPNSKFANLEAIQRTQLEVQGVIIKVEDSPEEEDSDDSNSCIVVNLEDEE